MLNLSPIECRQLVERLIEASRSNEAAMLEACKLGGRAEHLRCELAKGNAALTEALSILTPLRREVPA